jgi:hypothetical protein
MYIYINTAYITKHYFLKKTLLLRTFVLTNNITRNTIVDNVFYVFRDTREKEEFCHSMKFDMLHTISGGHFLPVFRTFPQRLV